MTAKEMFEKQEFLKEIIGNTICYIKRFSNGNEVSIEFDLDEKLIYVNVALDKELLEALNQQCEELGWIND